MMSRRALLQSVAATAAVGLVSSRAAAANEEASIPLRALSPPAPLPEVDLRDSKGGIHKASDILGRGEVLCNFLSLRCAPCMSELPELARAASLLKDTGIKIIPVGVHFGEPFSEQSNAKLVSDLESYLKKNGLGNLLPCYSIETLEGHKAIGHSLNDESGVLPLTVAIKDYTAIASGFGEGRWGNNQATRIIEGFYKSQVALMEAPRHTASNLLPFPAPQ